MTSFDFTVDLKNENSRCQIIAPGETNFFSLHSLRSVPTSCSCYAPCVLAAKCFDGIVTDLLARGICAKYGKEWKFPLVVSVNIDVDLDEKCYSYKCEETFTGKKPSPMAKSRSVVISRVGAGALDRNQLLLVCKKVGLHTSPKDSDHLLQNRLDMMYLIINWPKKTLLDAMDDGEFEIEESLTLKETRVAMCEQYITQGRMDDLFDDLFAETKLEMKEVAKEDIDEEEEDSKGEEVEEEVEEEKKLVVSESEVLLAKMTDELKATQKQVKKAFAKPG